METSILPYSDLMAAAIAEAEDEIGPPEGNDINAVMAHQGKVLTRASQIVASNMDDMIKVMVHMMWKVEKDKLYKYMPEKFDGLREWARKTYSGIVESQTYTWDYISRMVAFVELALPDIELRKIVNEDGVVVADADTVVANASPTAMAQMTYYYNNAEPDTRREIVLGLVSGKSSPALNDLKEQVREEINRRENPDDPNPPKKQPIKIVAQYDVNGDVKLSATLKENDFKLVAHMLGRSVEFAFA